MPAAPGQPLPVAVTSATLPGLWRSAVSSSWPLIVVGAGAAGITAATFAARAGCRTLLLETRPQPGAKIRVSGGGRCNVLPSVASPDDFWTGGSRPAMRNVLASWPLKDVHDYFSRDLGVPLKVEATGKVFPRSDSSREVVGALLAAARAAGVQLQTGSRIARIARSENGFELEGEGGSVLRAARLVLATGGKSLPKTGSDGAGYGFVRRLGHTVRETYPALVPLTAPPGAWSELSGVSAPVELRVVREGRVLDRLAGDFLFTHRGYSGPVVLDASRWFTAPEAAGVALRVRWGAPDEPWESVLQAGGKRQVATEVRARLPRRLADRLVAGAGVAPETPLAQLRREQRAALLEQLRDCPLPVQGSEGYRTAEVTAGGVPLEEVHGKTLESRRTPGLHLAGEILDVTGRLGGYNFLWAWASGRMAGLGAARGAG